VTKSASIGGFAFIWLNGVGGAMIKSLWQAVTYSFFTISARSLMPSLKPSK
jgi:hypothetical protein